MSHLQNLAQQIAQRGVQYIFGIPGSGPSLTLIDALEKRGIPFYLTHFEGTAAIMAGAIGRLSGRSQVAICIKGPGLANLLPGLAACALDSFPLVSISEAFTPNTPSIKAHKRLDHEKLLAGVTKGERFLSETGATFEQMAAWAEAEMPGPVHFNIANVPYPDDRPVPSGRRKDTVSLPARAQKLLASSNRPLVIAGSLAVRRHWSNFLNDLKIPVFTTSAAKGVVNETLPHAGGVFTGVGGPLAPESVLLPETDLIIGLGLRHIEVLDVKPFGCPTIQVDPLGESVTHGFAAMEYIPGSSTQLEELFSLLGRKEWGGDLLSRAHHKLRDTLFTEAFLPAHVYELIESHFRHRARFVLDTGNFCTIGEHVLQVPHPEWYIASGQGRYMGIGLPQGIAASLFDPEVPTVVFTGDGGIGMFIAEVKMAVRHKLPLLIVLLSDSYLGTVRGESLKRNLTQAPTTIYGPSWIKVMEGFDVMSERAEDRKSLENILNKWTMKGPMFIEVPFDPDEYQKMTDKIR